MYDSLRRHCPASFLWVLCLDQRTLEELTGRALANMELISLKELEGKMAELPSARANRSLVEYYFTCSPALPLFLLNSNPHIDLITYLDSDLYFYANPESLFSEIGNGSVAIIPHRFWRKSPELEQHGLYNVGWVTFRRDQSGIACLRWWYERCLEWCYHRPEDGKYADQKYLESFQLNFSNVVTIENIGANVGPWNLSKYEIRATNGCCTVDGAPLIFFHFQGFRQITRFSYATGLFSYHISADHGTLRMIFEPYIKKLLELAPCGMIEQGLVHRNDMRGSFFTRLLRRFAHFPRAVKEHAEGMRLFFLFGRVI